MNGLPKNKANECRYKEQDRKLKEKFINNTDDNNMITEITRELTSIKNLKEITSEQVLCWVKELWNKDPRKQC